MSAGMYFEGIKVSIFRFRQFKKIFLGMLDPENGTPKLIRKVDSLPIDTA